MKYIVETPKSVKQAVADLQASIARHQFDVLHIHDLQKEIKSKGEEFPNDCQVIEIDHPKSTKEMLMVNMELNLVYPVRVSVYSENGKTKIGMLRHEALLKIVSNSTKLTKIAKSMEKAIIAMIDESV